MARKNVPKIPKLQRGGIQTLSELLHIDRRRLYQIFHQPSDTPRQNELRSQALAIIKEKNMIKQF